MSQCSVCRKCSNSAAERGLRNCEAYLPRRRQRARAGRTVAKALRVLMAYSVLVVDRPPVALARWSAALRDVGYEVTATTSFAAARQRIANRPPNLLIASSRLGSYHGLHLVVCGHLNHAQLVAIVTTPSRDPVLEADATVFGAACVVAPSSRAEVLAVVLGAFSARPM